MKPTTILGLLVVTLFLLSPQSQALNGNSIGTLPAANSVQPTQKSSNTASKVRAGKEHTNQDGVTVTTDKGSGGYATIDPKHGSDHSVTNVVCRSGWKGTVEGLDQNDNVRVRSNSNGTVSGKGGTVTIAGGSTVTVSNTASPGGPNVTISTPGGTSQTIPPGSSTTVTT